jgi:enoyl-CoA hydratase
MTASSEVLTVGSDGPVRIVTLNRPDDRNAVNRALHDELHAVWATIATDPDARSVVLTGAGRTFSAGGDFAAMLANTSDPHGPARAMARARELILEMVRFPLPVIAAVNGAAVGMGANLAVLCDIVMMADTAFLADPHVSIGLVCGDGGAALWPLQMGLGQAKKYLFTGDRIPAAEAYRIGLATDVHPLEELMSRALELAHRLARQPAQALQDTKRAVNAHLEKALAGVLDVGVYAELASMQSPEHRRIVNDLAAR